MGVSISKAIEMLTPNSPQDHCLRAESVASYLIVRIPDAGITTVDRGPITCVTNDPVTKMRLFSESRDLR